MKCSIYVRRAALFLGLLMFFPFVLPAQVNEPELEKNLESVEFINYSGPYSRIDTRAQIRDIGYSLGKIIKDGAARAGPQRRYFVIHSITEGEPDKLNADIFGLGVDVGVDHIRNLRLILQGYLEAAYDYSAQDAALLANYITIYNAVYRGDWDYFESRYKKPVMQSQDRNKAGLSIRFDEWPGKTLLFIPLGTGETGSLSAVDTTPITEEKVIEQLRKEDDNWIEQRQGMEDLQKRGSEEAAQKAEAEGGLGEGGLGPEAQEKEEEPPGISLRKDMVDLKERESEQAGEKAQVEREAIKEEEQKIAEKREEIEEEKKAIEADEKNPDADQEELAQRKEDLAQREEDLHQEEENLEKMKEDAGSKEELARKKGEEAQKEREAITEEEQARAAASQPVWLLGTFLPQGEEFYLGGLLKVDAGNGRELQRSGITSVNIRTISFVGKRIFAVAGIIQGKPVLRLVEISPDTLEVMKEGKDTISAESLLWVQRENLYALTASGEDRFLARFNLALVLQAQSTVPVHSYATPFFDEDLLLTQRADGSVVVLDTLTLKEQW